jgi:thymidylate synthase (FAD)
MPKSTTFEKYDARRQDTKNRQNSLDDLSEETKQWFSEAQTKVNQLTSELYFEALDKEIAKECARFLLPLSVQTKLYMKGSVRSWIHYFQVRLESSTQKEHREVAAAVWPLFKERFPVVAEAIEGDYVHPVQSET